MSEGRLASAAHGRTPTAMASTSSLKPSRWTVASLYASQPKRINNQLGHSTGWRVKTRQLFDAKFIGKKFRIRLRHGISAFSPRMWFATVHPMPKEKTKTKKPKLRARYSIGEWYGAGFELLTASERFARAKTECDADSILGVACPFQTDAKCNKKGGVCSLRQYQQVGHGPVAGVGPVITTCPQRFLESDTIFRWVGETLLQTKQPVILSEIGFLDRLRPVESEDTSLN
jgi:hypothetical protein